MHISKKVVNIQFLRNNKNRTLRSSRSLVYYLDNVLDFNTTVYVRNPVIQHGDAKWAGGWKPHPQFKRLCRLQKETQV